MKKTIEQISKSFYVSLPKGEDRFKVENLSFPSFLKQRMKIAVKTAIASQITFPDVNWVNDKAEEVQQTKALYLNAVFGEARVPKDSAKVVIEKSVEEIVKILVQPRKNIPEILFKDEDILTKKALNEKVKKLTVYQHFAQVLSAYVEKKGHSEISKEKCKAIIANVDEKLTKNYPPLQWAQLLEPLFVLQEEPDSNLFRLFFEDKKMPRRARAFELKDGTISCSKFIEILSSPDHLNLEGYESDQSEMFTDENESGKKGRFSPPPPVANEGDPEANKTFEAAAQQEENEKPDIKREPENEEGTLLNKNKSDSDNEEKNTVNTVFSAEEESDEDQKSLNEIFAEKQVEKQKNKKEDKNSTEAADVQYEVKAEEDTKSKTAIWQRFIKKDEPAEDEANVKATSGSIKNESNNKREEQLKQQLQDKKQVFVEALFDGSELNYEESISKIATNNSWKEAIKTIQNDIFERYDVNMYSEAAVKFTDQLHEYFT